MTSLPMLSSNKFYAIDDKKRVPGVIEVDFAKATELNGKGWGIFHTPNTFEGQRRAENLVSINYWFVDIDGGDKAEHLKRLQAAILRPSVVVETKNGLHAYWEAKKAGIKRFLEIEERLIWQFKADPQVKDLPRLLRMPGFYHHKAEPFLVKIVEARDMAYSETEMLFAFKAAKTKTKNKNKPELANTNLANTNLDKLLKPQYIREGERNGKIFKKGVFLKKLGCSQNQVEEGLRWLNNNIATPLDEKELNLILKGYDKWRI